MKRIFAVGVRTVICLTGTLSTACVSVTTDLDNDGPPDDVSEGLTSAQAVNDVPTFELAASDVAQPLATSETSVRYFVHKVPLSPGALPTCGYIDPQSKTDPVHHPIDKWGDEPENRAARAAYLKKLRNYWSGSRLGGKRSGSHFCVYTWIGKARPVLEALTDRRIAVWSPDLVLNPSHPEVYRDATNTTCGIDGSFTTCASAPQAPPCTGTCTIPAGSIICDSCGTVIDEHSMMVVLPAADGPSKWTAPAPLGGTAVLFDSPPGEQTFIVHSDTPLTVGEVRTIEQRL